MNTVLNLIAPHIDAIITGAATAIAGLIAFLVKKTQTDIDDKAAKKIAEEVAKKL